MPYGVRVIDRVGDMTDWDQASFADGEYARWAAGQAQYVGAPIGAGSGVGGGGLEGQVAFWVNAADVGGSAGLRWDGAALVTARVTGLAAPTEATDAVNRAYADVALARSWMGV